jgi:hypothetical protein
MVVKRIQQYGNQFNHPVSVNKPQGSTYYMISIIELISQYYNWFFCCCKLVESEVYINLFGMMLEFKYKDIPVCILCDFIN